ncbi:hypothetical protein GCWU000342_00719 [Shuttleworthella satelles DSM 14600]|uniref:Uncharacterized protein n=1 Tax=Shuttleworthella satelles DSM 14600 TaxID=626523 RepID=C4G9R5_9FIRM|nr:hypothetical protein GCWU000342_00719 [Shuttleworthia satelles DSM 14600]
MQHGKNAGCFRMSSAILLCIGLEGTRSRWHWKSRVHTVR